MGRNTRAGLHLCSTQGCLLSRQCTKPHDLQLQVMRRRSLDASPRLVEEDGTHVLQSGCVKLSGKLHRAPRHDLHHEAAIVVCDVLLTGADKQRAQCQCLRAKCQTHSPAAELSAAARTRCSIFEYFWGADGKCQKNQVERLCHRLEVTMQAAAGAGSNQPKSTTLTYPRLGPNSVMA